MRTGQESSLGRLCRPCFGQPLKGFREVSEKEKHVGKC